MEALIPVINKLQHVVSEVGTGKALKDFNLPQIVVVGSQVWSFINVPKVLREMT